MSKPKLEVHLTALRKRLKAMRGGSKLQRHQLMRTIEHVKMVAGVYA